MKNRLSGILIFSIALLMLACQGKQGDPGPAGTNGTNGTNGASGANGAQGQPGTDPSGPFINGAFKGIVSGTSQDSIAFTDSINYPYAIGREYFQTTPIGNILSLIRTKVFDETYSTFFNNGFGSLELVLIVTNLGVANQTVTLESYFLHFDKITTGNQILEVDGNSLILSDTKVIYPIDPQNQTYLFTYDLTQFNISQGPTTTRTYNQTKFLTTIGDTVYYDDPQISSGGFVKVVDVHGATSTISATYSSIHLVTNQTDNGFGGFTQYVTFSDATSTDLSKTIIIPADTYSITNFVYNTSTANLSFDYTFNSGILSNSTKHSLTLTGTFTGAVYVIKN